MRSPGAAPVGAAVALCLLLSPASSLAEITRTLQIDSTPRGAEVFLLQGSKETRIGVTPFAYQAEFHSDLSVLRLAARKAGYETKRIEISAKDQRVLFALSGRSFAAAPKDVNDPALRKLQEEIGPALDKIAPEALKSQKPFQIDLAGNSRAQKVGGKVYLIVPVQILRGPDRFRQISSANAESFLAELWAQLGDALVVPLAQAAKSVKGLDGIILDAGYSGMQSSFSVGAKTETYYEMVCQPGTKPQSTYDSCATRRTVQRYDSVLHRYTSSVECQGGTVVKNVYDPCATKVPAARTRAVTDPRIAFKTANSKVRYVVNAGSFPASASAQRLYGDIGALVTDNGGNVIARRGSVPPALSGR